MFDIHNFGWFNVLNLDNRNFPSHAHHINYNFLCDPQSTLLTYRLNYDNTTHHHYHQRLFGRVKRK